MTKTLCIFPNGVIDYVTLDFENDMCLVSASRLFGWFTCDLVYGQALESDSSKRLVGAVSDTGLLDEDDYNAVATYAFGQSLVGACVLFVSNGDALDPLTYDDLCRESELWGVNHVKAGDD